jgi:HD-like signal output (HDOD) protein
MIQLLFVDGDASYLAQLEQRLHPHRDEWDMHFANGAAAALDQIASTTFDVIVADAVDAETLTDGTSWLAHVATVQPAAVRIVMSRDGLAPTFASKAHQVLPKPCDPPLLRSVILRTIELRARLSDPEVLAILGSLKSLPSPSTAMLELQRVLDLPDADTAKVAKVVSTDVAMSAKLLQIVNSSFYGLSRTVDDPAEAVRLLGAHLVGEILLTVGLLDAVAGRDSALEGQLQSMRDRSLARADLASALAERAGRATTVVRRVWNGAFLLDIGKMLLLGTDHEHDPEAERLHATIGGALLAMWGLPQQLVETVAMSDLPPQASSGETLLYGWLAAAFLAVEPEASDTSDASEESGHDEAAAAARAELTASVVRWAGLASADLSAYRPQPAPAH